MPVITIIVTNKDGSRSETEHPNRGAAHEYAEPYATSADFCVVFLCRSRSDAALVVESCQPVALDTLPLS
jgi:hypothetical protein